VAAGLALLALPLDRRLTTFALDWRTAAGLPWGVLILFGGGLSLAGAIDRTGAAEYLGSQASALTGLPPLAFILLATTGVIFLTELTSNTATAAVTIPQMARAGLTLNLVAVMYALVL
jgi:sodium-dependent dicarboxylate transporter 2/3/5